MELLVASETRPAGPSSSATRPKSTCLGEARARLDDDGDDWLGLARSLTLVEAHCKHPHTQCSRCCYLGPSKRSRRASISRFHPAQSAPPPPSKPLSPPSPHRPSRLPFLSSMPTYIHPPGLLIKRSALSLASVARAQIQPPTPRNPRRVDSGLGLIRLPRILG